MHIYNYGDNKLLGKRPIIVRFQYYADRQCIWNKQFHLKATAYILYIRVTWLQI